MSESASNLRLGRFVEPPMAGEIVCAFVPFPLPPEPSIDVLALLEKLSMAEWALGRLDGITMRLPRQELFLYMYVRQEAVLSSQIVHLFKEDREWITTESDRVGSALRIHGPFQQNPFLTANQFVRKTGLSAPTVNVALADLERFGIVEEITRRKQWRVFSYRQYLSILSEGADPLPTTA